MLFVDISARYVLSFSSMKGKLKLLIKKWKTLIWQHCIYLSCIFPSLFHRKFICQNKNLKTILDGERIMPCPHKLFQDSLFWSFGFLVQKFTEDIRCFSNQSDTFLPVTLRVLVIGFYSIPVFPVNPGDIAAIYTSE